MRLAVFGGTGRVGRWLVEHASAAGHTIRALVRDPARLPAGMGGQGVVGDVSDAVAVQTTIEGCDAVCSALGGGPLERPGTILSDGMRNIVAAMGRHGIRRVLAVAGAGVLDHPRGGLRGEAPAFPAMFRAITAEHLGTWRALRESGLDWTLVCCPDLVDGAGSGRYRVAADLLPDGASMIAAEHVAEFMLQQVDLAPFVRRRVGIGY